MSTWTWWVHCPLARVSRIPPQWWTGPLLKIHGNSRGGPGIHLWLGDPVWHTVGFDLHRGHNSRLSCGMLWHVSLA